MDDANGTHKGPRAAPAINGIKSPLNGHAVGPKKRAAPSGPGLLARTFNVVARLLTWYSILTILFRCPATLEACDETSPLLCKPYFQIKRAAAPHIEPYYDAYAAPYVEVVRPYYNAVDRSIIAPSWGVAKQYGAPRLQQAQAFSSAQWEKHVEPQVAKYQGLAKTRYDQSLAPHIDRVSTAFGPYYNIARTNALQTYHDLLLPAYLFVQPHMREGYRVSSAFASSTIVPGFAWGWNKTYVFLDGTVWPQLRAVYVENVEPQLVKIGKRLGRYSSGKKTVPKLVTDSSTSSSAKTTSSFTKPAVSVTTSTSATPSAEPTQGESRTESARTRTPIEHIPPPEVDEKLEKEDPVRRTTREIVAADLKDWQERYAKAADEGAAEIDDRVQEIATRMIQRNARGMGKSLLEQLQEASVSELVELRRAILDIIGTVNKGDVTAEAGQEQIVKAVRTAGMAVKQKAQDVRTWRENYENEMQAAITKAAETHFGILENIRDLALQKIGMKWAWMDGVTYKDWAKYHLLKSRFDEWKGDLENLIVTHPSLEAAQIEGANIEDEAMKVAATAARELARLKQVAHWKLVAGDESPEFDSTLTQQAAEAVEAAKLAAANAAETVSAAAQEAVEDGASLASEAVSKVTEVLGTESAADESVSQASTDASDLGATEANLGASSSGPEDQTAPASEELFSVVEPTSEATLDAEGGADEADDAAQDPPVASSLMFETPVMVGNATELDEGDTPAKLPVELPVEDQHAETDDDVQHEFDTEEPTGLPVSNAASVKPALFGAAAQSVPSRSPILEDDVLDDVSSAMESMRDDLKSAYSAAMSRANQQYSQALSIVSAQIRGTPQPAHEQMLASVTSAYSKAMASASARMDDALRAASTQLHGTTTKKSVLPTKIPVPQVPEVEWSQIESIAAERLRQGRALAEEQYESAKIAIGLATPAPSTPAEHVSKLLDNAKHNYYAGLGLAQARYSDFLSGASSALSSMTATPTPTDLAGSASSIASVASGSAASAASVASGSAASAASVASGSVSSAASAVSEGASSALSAASAGVSSAASVASENASSVAAAGYDKASAAGDAVSEGWEAVVTRISIQVYGAPVPTPWYSSIYDAASEYASSATSAAGDTAASATSAAGAYVSAGSEEAAKHYSAAQSIVSELLIGKEPSFSESVLSRLSAAYATGASSASSLAGAVQETAASAANQAGEAVKSAGDRVASAASDATEAVKHVRDEL